MLKRISRNYLWVGLIVAFALGPVRQAAGTGVFVIAEAVHLALIAAAVWASGAMKGSAGRADEHPAFLPGILLISGPLVLYAGASTGPPTPARAGDYLFNTTGLLLGVLIMVLGFALLSARLWESGERTWSVLGLAGLLVGVVFYALNMISRYAQIAAGAATPFVEAERQVSPGIGNLSLPLEAQPTWSAFVWVLFTLMLAAYGAIAYLAAAAYAAAMLRTGWIGRTGGGIFVMLGSTLGLIMSAGWLFLDNPIVETLLFFLGVPFVTVILPYYMGVVLIGDTSRRAKTVHSADTRVGYP